MSFFKQLQKLNVVWKKVIVFAIIIVLAVPLLIFIGNNFQKRTRKFQERSLFEELKVSELQQEIGGSFEGLEEVRRELEVELQKPAEITTSTTSTNSE